MTEPEALEWEHLTTSQSPAVIDYQGVPYMILPYADTNVLTWSVFNGQTWGFKGALPTDTGIRLTSRSAPVLIEVRGTVLMVYEGFDPKHQLYYAQWAGGNVWEDRGRIKAMDGTVLQAKATPSLVRVPFVDNRERVFMAYHGTDDYIYSAEYDGQFWVNLGRVLFHT